jgi:hypothetical protein
MPVPYQYKFAHPVLAKFLFPNLLAQRYFFCWNLFCDGLTEKVLLVVFPALVHSEQRTVSRKTTNGLSRLLATTPRKDYIISLTPHNHEWIVRHEKIALKRDKNHISVYDDLFAQ